MKKKSIINILIILMITSLIISISNILTYKNNISKNKKQFEELKIKNNINFENEYIKNQHNISELIKKYNDMIGWIYIPNTNINYPIMNSESYLNKDFEGNKSISGTPFIDKNSSINPRSQITIIHGHNMKDGSMFNNLIKYTNEDFFNCNKDLIFYTENSVEFYNIISANFIDITTEHNKIYSYSNINETFSKIINETSIFNKVEIDNKSNIIILSTCDNNNDNKRIIIIAKKIQ